MSSDFLPLAVHKRTEIVNLRYLLFRLSGKESTWMRETWVLSFPHCGVPGAPVSPRPTPTGSDLSTTTPSTGGGGQAFWE